MLIWAIFHGTVKMLPNNTYFTIVGPTASGKTSLAIEVAKKINGEIIGLDSRQIYKGMEIGTAQPSKQERDGVIHHLIGCLDPCIRISAGQYAKKIHEKIHEIENNGKVPLICGGAGLYYRSITMGLFEESSTNIKIRKSLETIYKKSPEALMKKLQLIDPEYAEIVHINNRQRLVRALEIYQITGKPPTKHFKNQKKNNQLKLFTIYLDWERSTLNKRIVIRAKDMISNGWFDEAKSLYDKQDKSKIKYPALNSIGYSQIIKFFKGEINKSELEESIIIETRQFAKKQSQWFAKEKLDLILKMDGLKLRTLPEILYCILVAKQ